MEEFSLTLNGFKVTISPPASGAGSAAKSKTPISNEAIASGVAQITSGFLAMVLPPTSPAAVIKTDASSKPT